MDVLEKCSYKFPCCLFLQTESFFFISWKYFQPVLHQTVYHGTFTVLMYMLEYFNNVVYGYVIRIVVVFTW